MLIVETITPFQREFNINDILKYGNNKAIKSRFYKIKRFMNAIY